MSIQELETEIMQVKRMLAYYNLKPNQITDLTIALIELQSSLIQALKQELSHGKAA